MNINIEASVVRDKINERFYWDSNEQILLYTLPSGNVSVVADTNEYTEVNEQKSVDYTILKMEGDKVYIALPYTDVYQYGVQSISGSEQDRDHSRLG